MAVTYRRARRAGQIPAWLVGLTVVAAVVAVLPIVAAILGGNAGKAPRTAFASAGQGAYVVGLRAGETEDVLLAVPGESTGQAIELTRVPHIAGQVTSGAVSPDGRRVALVVAEAGTVAAPGYALLSVELETGAVRRLAVAVDGLQTPAWARDSESLVFTRSASVSESRVDVRFVRVPAGGGEETAVATSSKVLGAYSVGFDGAGRFLSVTIDERGSTLVRDGAELRRLGTQVTRDWRLNGDGTGIAYIESDTTGGLRYRSRLESVEPGGAGVQAQSTGNEEGQSLGVAWSPAGGVAFGREPGATGGGAVQAQSLAAPGFDVPLAYSPDGAALVVQAWTGRSFADPGTMTVTVVDASGRRAIAEMTRVLGWSMR